MDDPASQPDEAALAALLKDIVGKCSQLAGGTNGLLHGELVERGVGDVADDSVISKWRNFEKYRKVPKPHHVEALVDLIEDKLQGEPDGGAALATELKSVCAKLTLLSGLEIEPTLDDLLRQTSGRIRALFSARPHSTLSIDTIDLIQQALLGELNQIVLDPTRLAVNLRYTVEIIGDDAGWKVTTENRASRVYFGTQEVFVSFCSTAEGLDHEYNAQAEGCIARELVPAAANDSFEQWEQAVLAYGCTLRVDGRLVKLGNSERVSIEGPGFVVRKRFDISATDLSRRMTPTMLKLQFGLPLSTDQFPIHFNSYYCTGTTQIRFKITHKSFQPLVTRSVFLPSTQSAPFEDLSELPNEIELETSQRTVLTPGAGVLFRWTQVTDDGEPHP